MKTVAKILWTAVRWTLMAFGLISVLYAVYMWASEHWGVNDLAHMADKDDCGSDFP